MDSPPHLLQRIINEEFSLRCRNAQSLSTGSHISASFRPRHHHIMSSLRPRPRCVLLLHASAALFFLFLGTEPAPLSVLAAELRRMGERDEEDMPPQCNPPLPAAALILFLLDLRLHHPCEPGSSQREGVGCPTDEAIPIPMFVPTSLNNAPQIALPTLPTQAPRKYEHTLHFLLQTRYLLHNTIDTWRYKLPAQCPVSV